MPPNLIVAGDNQYFHFTYEIFNRYLVHFDGYILHSASLDRKIFQSLSQ